MDNMINLIGIPYVDGGRTIKGLDCWGLVIQCINRMGIETPDPFKLNGKDAIPKEDWAAWIYQQFSGWKRLDEPVPFSVVVFANKDGIPDHAGVMIDHQRFIHCVRKAGVIIGRLDKCPYKLLGAYEYRRT